MVTFFQSRNTFQIGRKSLSNRLNIPFLFGIKKKISSNVTPVTKYIDFNASNQNGVFASTFYQNQICAASPDFSIHILFKPSDFSVDQILIGRSNSITITQNVDKKIIIDTLDHTYSANSFTIYSDSILITDNWYVLTIFFNPINSDFVKAYINGSEVSTERKTGSGTNIVYQGYYPLISDGPNAYFGGISYIGMNSGQCDVDFNNNLYSNGDFSYPSSILDLSNGQAIIAENQPSLTGNTYLTTSSGTFDSGEAWNNLTSSNLISFP